LIFLIPRRHLRAAAASKSSHASTKSSMLPSTASSTHLPTLPWSASTHANLSHFLSVRQPMRAWERTKLAGVDPQADTPRSRMMVAMVVLTN